jgi:hypothetical protein
VVTTEATVPEAATSSKCLQFPGEAARMTALSLEELRGRSFLKILERRRG